MPVLRRDGARGDRGRVRHVGRNGQAGLDDGTSLAQSGARGMRVTPERYREIENLFARVVEQPGSEREATLAAAGLNDPDLAAEVRSLLAAHDSPGPMDDVELGTSLQWVGPYRVLRELGSG